MRREAVYNFLIEVARSNSDRLQIILADNDLPDAARPFVRLELSEEERLIPADELVKNES